MKTCEQCGALFLTVGTEMPPTACRACDQQMDGDYWIRLRDLTPDERRELRLWANRDTDE